jgi:hypothetical protein
MEAVITLTSRKRKKSRSSKGSFVYKLMGAMVAIITGSYPMGKSSFTKPPRNDVASLEKVAL